MLSINLKSVFWGVKAATAIGKNNLSIINIQQTININFQYEEHKRVSRMKWISMPKPICGIMV